MIEPGEMPQQRGVLEQWRWSLYQYLEFFLSVTSSGYHEHIASAVMQSLMQVRQFPSNRDNSHLARNDSIPSSVQQIMHEPVKSLASQ